MIHKTVVLVSELQAMRLFASEDEARFVLNGVLVEIWQDKTLLVATNGRTIAIHKTECFQPHDHVSATRFIVPSERIERLKPIPRYKRDDEKNHVTIAFDDREKDTNLWIDHAGAMMQLRGQAIPSEYPAWRRTLPTGKPKPCPVTAFNAAFFADLAKAAALLGASDSAFIAQAYHDEDSLSSGVHEVRFPGVAGFYCAMMPLKSDGIPQRQQWLSLGDSAKSKEAA